MSRFILALLLILVPSIGSAQDARISSLPMHAQPASARHGMVVAQEKIAAKIGADVLRHGGNAVDAAVATAFAMAVTYPRAGNIGGGGFMVIHLARENKDLALDYRETAPAAATPTMFLGPDGKPDAAKSRDGALGIGVPGTVAGLTDALQRYGSGNFTLRELLLPAIRLARDGFVITDDIADTLPDARKRFAPWPSSAALLARADGTPLREGDKLIQPDLANTLQAIADHGTDGFYDGPVAQKLASAIQAAGGIVTRDDLKAYRPVWREPVRGSYRGYDIVSMPLPSSGGTVLIETLNILEGFDLHKMGAQTPASLHVLIEAMKRAYADRARYLGDPAFSKAPLTRLLSKDYAAQLRADISPDKSTAVKAAAAQPHEGTNTTHFSVVDAQGNAVSNTYTLNFSYGVGLIAEGTGVLLNNELDDFTAAPGASNAYGLVGYEANLPGPGKRPLSSMTPTIVLKDGRPVLVTGSPGGSRIISTTLQVIVNTLDYRMNIAQAVSLPRLHHQWMPDEVRIEHGFPQATRDALRAMGHTLVTPMGQTSANSIAASKDGWLGAADPRTRGAEAAGY
ncbi:gamma-glutamyltransferase [[Pseudomonas] carboxydohydrogena]|uniref:Glutathione hydrolase proenzyme n=1 Tax=Afipia carboxydohydrogena TaxID=290 RepID=A0ABY8BQ26_AFICR|nr:gamma-glutamyltransferase [[Pseudomonas] carboxydohydrogena]WEF51784.1 gamma-glutamyltransferase [[Pseudomonas] carboxydohydrogena]